MYKMVVTDVDYTLVETGKEVSEKNKNIIKKLQDNHIIFTLASGRHSNLLKRIYDTLGIQYYAISSNGSVINNPLTGEHIKLDYIEDSTVYEVINVATKHNTDLVIYSNEMAIAKKNKRLRFLDKLNTRLEKEYQIPYLAIEDNDTIESYVNHNIVKILIMFDNEELLKEINADLKNIDKIDFASSGNGLMVISPKGSNKGNAIKYLASYYNINMDEVIAFGDEENDIQMLQNAGLGIAMGNASDSLKKVADDITDDVYHDGFASAIEKHIFQKK